MPEIFCAVCRSGLSPEQIRKNARTCGPDCKKALTRIRRALKKSASVCPTCGQTVHQRASARVRGLSGATVESDLIPQERAS